jgi:hypothetical protein
MLPSSVRAVIVSWFVALCAVIAGAPTARVQLRDPHAAGYASVAAPAIVAVSTRGTMTPGHRAAPDPRLAMVGMPARAAAFTAPDRTFHLAPLDAVSLPYVALLLSRSARGPPV